MKKNFVSAFPFSFLLLVALLFSFRGNAQYTIPDANFANWLNQYYPSIINGDQLDTTHPNVALITSLDVDGLAISNLSGIQYFTGLTMLYCSDNQLTTLPPLPSSISYLNCSYNQLITLPSLPDSLHILLCIENQLTNIPTLPPSLTDLFCSNNQLTVLPALPSSLTLLSCNWNPLTTLPVLPNSLERLGCAGIQLSTWPELPPALNYFSCGFNQLTALPPLPHSLIELHCENNQIACFDWLPPIGEITNNPVSCVPNSTSYTVGYPLCHENDPVNNPNNCPQLNGITGSVYYDSSDCSANGNEIPLANIPFRLYDDSHNFLAIQYTNAFGEYSFPYDNGTFQVVLDSTFQQMISYCFADTTVTFSGNHIDSVDFYLHCNGSADYAVNGIVPFGMVFPGQIHYLDIYSGYAPSFYSLNCPENATGTLTITIDGPVTYSSPAGSWTPTQIIGNTIVYTIPDFSQIGCFFDDGFSLSLLTDSTALSGDSICVTATLTVNGNDANPLNNTMQWCYEAINSYDPNHKEVSASLVPLGFEDYLTYTIYFQNTGTAPAINIRLEDDLSDDLNYSTFELLQSSHPVVTSLYGQHLRFRFNNIQLADSLSNEPASHGFVQYRIKPKAGLTNGTVIRNTVSIYFDYNAPIVTNTAETFVGTLSVNTLAKEVLVVYPNPVTDQLHLSVKAPYEILNISVSDLNGRILQTQTFHSGEALKLSVADLADGYYLLELHTDHSAEPVVISFVKE